MDFSAGGNSYGGDSGYFTKIILAKREEDFLQLVEEIAGGDRCNGGIVDVQLKNDKLMFEQYITPYQLLFLSEALPETVDAYGDLVACASCCIGKVLVEYNFQKPKLLSISLDNKVLEEGREIEQGEYQVCLNKLLKEYHVQNKLIFSPNELKRLTEKFNRVCLPSVIKSSSD